ncbi:unnamed protein product [Pylaiella littoralis]
MVFARATPRLSALRFITFTTDWWKSQGLTRSNLGVPCRPGNAVVPVAPMDPSSRFNSRGYTSSCLNSKGEPEVTLERMGAAGGVAWLTLSKPEKLNALSMTMVRGMSDAIEEHWSGGGAPRLLVLEGSGGKAFCAGGDVKAIAQSEWLGLGVAGTLRSDFFREEYRLDYRLANIAKEQQAVLSLWDGVVMGGGVGISIHGTFRVATETSSFAMPETVIGLFPDVGTAHVLSRLPGGLGQYLGLTGARLHSNDLLHCGLATHLVPRDRLPELGQALSADDGKHPAQVLQRFASEDADPASSMLAQQNKRWIDEAFCGAASVEEIVRRLEGMTAPSADGSGREWAQGALESLSKASPTALKVTHRHISWAATATLKGCLEQDFRVMQHMMTIGDFDEGVRALLIDKDNQPAWSPPTLEGVSASTVDALFSETQPGDPVF